jgi:hypothetical protein
MELMDQQLDALLDIVADRILPEIFQIWDNAPSITDNTGTDGIEHFLVRVIDQMKKGYYFFVFLHGVRPGLYVGKIA